MLDTVFGLPVHPLIVHATVTVVPAAAVSVALAVLWPRFREWAGLLPLALSVLAVVLTPLSTGSGESLERSTGRSALVADHARLADLLIWWVVPLAAVAAAHWWTRRRRTPGTALRVALPAAAVVLAAGTLVQVVLIGHSGARAAWSTTSASAPVSGRPTPG